MVARVRELYKAGRFLDANEAAAEFGGVVPWAKAAYAQQDWTAMLLATRLAGQLGGGRLAEAMTLRALRRAGDRADVAVYALYALLGTRGPWRLWLEMKRRGDTPGTFETDQQYGSNPDDETPDKLQSNYFALRARLRGVLRDFAPAEADLARALALTPDDPWCHVEHCILLDMEDRREEALDAVERAIALRPEAASAIDLQVQMLLQLDRRDEARERLVEACERLQSGRLWMSRAALHRTLEEATLEREALEEALRHLPLLDEAVDRRLARFLAGRRGDILYREGRLRDALPFTEQAAGPREAEGEATPNLRDREHKLWRKMTDRVRAHLDGLGPDADEPAELAKHRRQLDVPFVRQNHVTCVPATLTSLAKFWDAPAEHLEIAEEICYDGTPSQAERQWAINQGWHVREFSLDFETVVALIDRGLPFTMTTVAATSAHEQAVVGYDRIRRSLLIRDPGDPGLVEGEFDGMLEDQGEHGLRCMLMVPADKAALADEVALPEAELHDLYFALNTALVAHNRAAAGEAVAAMVALDETGRLTLLAQQVLARYDADATVELRLAEAVVERYPKSDGAIMRLVSALESVGQYARARAVLEEAAAKPEMGDALRERLVYMLLGDAREGPRLRRMLAALVRRNPQSPVRMHMLGQMLWAQGEQRRDDARDAARFAATLDDKAEQWADTWLSMERLSGEGDAAISVLRERAERFGHKSSGPTLTLHRALWDAGLGNEAIAALQAGLAKRPDDPDLLLTAASVQAEVGKDDAADALLERAKPVARRATWLGSAAQVRGIQGRLEESKQKWVELADAEPLTLAARNEAARRIGDLDGPAAATAYLAEACERFPNHGTLRVMLYRQQVEHDPGGGERTLRSIVSSDPNDAWALRELAIYILFRKRATSPRPPTEQELNEVREVLQRAGAIEPDHPTQLRLQADLAKLAGDRAAAETFLLRAIDVAPGETSSMANLMDLARTPEEAKRTARRLADLLAGKRVDGETVNQFSQVVRNGLSPQDVRDVLANVQQARPDLWQAWDALALQELRVDNLDAARRVAREATRRFPLVADLWLTLAIVHRVALDPKRREAALRQALKVAPSDERVTLALADYMVDEGDHRGSLTVLESGLKRSPRNVALLNTRALTLWSAATTAEEGEAAFEAAVEALEVDADDERLVTAMSNWSEQLGDAERGLNVLRRLVRERPGDARLRLSVARMLFSPRHVEEALAEVEKTIELEPTLEEAHDFKAEVLSTLRRFDEAQAACHPAALGDPPPMTLRGRAAAILADRGDTAGAITAMQAVLDDWPQYDWGWRRVVEWAMATGDFDLAIRTGDDRAKALPFSPEALIESARVRLARADAEPARRDKDRAAAVDLLRRAHRLNPSDPTASGTLLAIHLEDNAADEATAMLEEMRPHLYAHYALAYDAAVQAAHGEWAQAATFLRELVTFEQPNAEPLSMATGHLRRFGQKAKRQLAQTRNAVAEMLLDERLSPPAAEVIVTWLVQDGQHKRAEQALASLAKRPGHPTVAWLHGVSGYLQSGIETVPKRLRTFATKHIGELSNAHGQAGDDAWGAGGFALSNSGAHADCARLMGDYAQREFARPWMMLNFTQSLGHLGRWGEALQASEFGLSLPPDHTTDFLCVWSALAATHVAEAESGASEPHQHAAGRLASVTQVDGLVPLYKLLYHLAAARVSAASAEDARVGLAEAKQHLRDAEQTGIKLRDNPPLRRLYKQAKLAAHRRVGGAGLLFARLNNLLT